MDNPSIEFDSWVEGLGEDYAESVTGGCTETHREEQRTTFDRFVRDNFRKVFAHYTVTVETLPDNGTYRLTFADSNAPADIRRGEEWKIANPSHYPVPQILREGDELALEMMTYPGGIKLRDYIHVGTPDKMARRADAARDFYAEDAEFSLARPSLRVNGEPLESATLPELLRGGVLWLYIPGIGRYVASYLPHAEAGFERAGELTSGLMTLTVHGNVVRITSAERIAPGGGVYNVYGKLDSAWTPADPQDRDRFTVGTSPAVETVLSR